MRRNIYLGTFVYALQGALLLFVNSSFLSTYVPLDEVGLLYISANLLSMLVLAWLPTLLVRYGHYHTFLTIIGVVGLALFGLATLNYPPILLALFLLPEALFMIVRVFLDLYLEEYSDKAHEGSNRAIFMTIINTSIALSPLLLGFLVVNNNFKLVYGFSFLATLLLGLITALYYHKIPDINYEHIPIVESVKKMWRNSDIRNVFISNLVLQFFFVWMVIYSPIYLHDYVGFSWEEIGTIFFIMLLPYVFLEIPLGKIADKYLGEKELLVAGFILMGLTTSLLTFVTAKSVILWAGLLFITRMGAASIEIMSETYFWKKIQLEDTEEASLFRNTKPIAYILGPLTGSAILAFVHPSYLFIILGLIVLLSTYFPLRLHDTK